MTPLMRTVAALAVLLPGTAALAAPPPPDPEIANSIVEYYYSDASAPVLMELEVCAGVHEKGPEEHDCTETLDPKGIAAGTDVYLWMKFLVPRDATADVLTQLNRGGITRRTFHRELGGALRYRTWHKVSFDDTGDWEVVVLHEGDDGVAKLRTVKLEVEAAEADDGD